MNRRSKEIQCVEIKDQGKSGTRICLYGTIDEWPYDPVCEYGSSQRRDWPDQPHLQYVSTGANRKAETSLIEHRSTKMVDACREHRARQTYFQDQQLSELDTKFLIKLAVVLESSLNRHRI